MAKVRTFIAVDLPVEFKEKVAVIQGKLKESNADVKWVAPLNFHITLKFLGYLEEAQLAKVIEHTEKIVKDFKPFELSFSGLGAFPEVDYPRVIWIGAKKGVEVLCKLAKSVEDELAKAGFPPDPKGFKSHLTLGRVKPAKGREALVGKLKEVKADNVGSIVVDGVKVMRSDLMPGGPVYSCLADLKFKI